MTAERHWWHLLIRLRICTTCLRYFTDHCEHCLACSPDHTCQKG